MFSDILWTASKDCEHYMEPTNVATIKMCPQKQQHVDLAHFIAEKRILEEKKSLVLMTN